MVLITNDMELYVKRNQQGLLEFDCNRRINPNSTACLKQVHARHDVMVISFLNIITAIQSCPSSKCIIDVTLGWH